MYPCKYRINISLVIISLALFLAVILISSRAAAQSAVIPPVELRVGGSEEPGELVGFLQLLLILTVLSLAPSIVVLMTSFTRIVIVLSFLRNALSTQQIPPNQLLIGLSLLLTFLVMTPTLDRINSEAIQPYLGGEIDQEEAFARGAAPLKEYMLYHTREKDLALFVNISGMDPPAGTAEVPMRVLIPSFVISELNTAFQMGFMLFIPFLIIDMVVASTLMSMGMFMLPPVIVSLPFKILLFVLVDGWHLVVKSLVESFG